MVDAFVGERKQTYDVEEDKAEELGASLSRVLVLTDSSRNKCVSECDRDIFPACTLLVCTQHSTFSLAPAGIHQLAFETCAQKRRFMCSVSTFRQLRM